MMAELREHARGREASERALVEAKAAADRAADGRRAAERRASSFEGRLAVLADELSRIVQKSSRSWDDVTALLQAHNDNPAPKHPPHFEAAALAEMTWQRGQTEREAARLRAQLQHARIERNGALRQQKMDNADLLVDLNSLRRENHRLKRALAKTKDMVAQHVASRYAGELAIERASTVAEELGSDESDDESEEDSEEGDERASPPATADARHNSSLLTSVSRARMTEQELELRALREQVSFFMSQPIAGGVTTHAVPTSVGMLHAGSTISSPSSAVSAAPTVRRGRANGSTQPAVRWERAGNTMMRKTVPLPPV